MSVNKSEVLKEIKEFLEGYDNEHKYIVHAEANPENNYAECIVHEPNKEKEIVKIEYTSFLYCKDFEKNNVVLYNGDNDLLESQMIKHGVEIIKLKTGNQQRLNDGYCYKITSHRSYKHILKFLEETNFSPYQKAYDEDGNLLRNNKGDILYPNRDFFYTLKPVEQFFIDRKIRLFKGIEEYKHIHRLIFDIETTGLRPEISRVFAIGVRDNIDLNIILEVDKTNDDESEINLIRDFFNLISLYKPDIIAGYNSEDFDFNFILERAKILKMDLTKIPTSLIGNNNIRRNPYANLKYGSSSEKYTATEMWGYSIIDIMHAAKKTAAINSDIDNVRLKYIAKFEDVAPPNRTYIKGEDNSIGRYYHENPFFIANDKNEHIEVPQKYTKIVSELFDLQLNKTTLKTSVYNEKRNKVLSTDDTNFVSWFREEGLPNKMNRFVQGRDLLRQYLSDDIYETAQIDELYNQSAFLLAKIVPTTFSKVSTMGTASIWNLLLTAWSHHNDLAIPIPDVKVKFAGGLARCFRTGFTKRIAKIDYSSLYPMEQMTWDIFPIFDITGVIKKMLMYTTTTRNIYKRLASGDQLKEEEIELLASIDTETYEKFISNTITDKDRALFKVKQLPIKILNNSLFGALGSDISFNWSDNTSAARITGNGRLDLRHAISYYHKFGCEPLLAVTDGINFAIPNRTNIIITDDETIFNSDKEGLIEDMWHYNGKNGLGALIDKYNKEEMIAPYMSVDNDGEFLSCFNLSRNNYALLVEYKDKKTGEMKTKVKLTGNTIKSKTMPEYVSDFLDKGLKLILEGKGSEFLEYYYDYVEDIYYKRIPLKKIASKSRVKVSLKSYLNRGTDKNGKQKAKQAHMELLLQERDKIIEEVFQEHKNDVVLSKEEDKLTIAEKAKLIAVYMPPEPELDSMVYYVNTGTRASHGDVKMIKDPITGEEIMASRLINNDDLSQNPDMLGSYNVDKYLKAFNSRVEKLFMGFEPEVAKKMMAKITRKKVVGKDGKKVMNEELVINQFTNDQLVLKSFELDDIDEAYHLQDREVSFWNDSGFDPRLVWGGFKMYDDNKVYFEIYENALKFLNEKMEKANKPLIKSRNDKLNKNDLVLLKWKRKYQLGHYNGIFIEIIRDDVEIPKSDLEIEMENKKRERLDKIKKLSSDELNSADEEYYDDIELGRRKYFKDFVKKYEIKDFDNYEDFIEKVGSEGAEYLDNFIEELKNEESNDIELDEEYISVDD